MGIHGRTLACDGTLGDEVTISQEQLIHRPSKAGASDIMVLARDEADLGPNNLDLLRSPIPRPMSHSLKIIPFSR